MQDFRPTRRSPDREDAGANSHALASSFGISLGVHVLVIAALIYFPSDYSKPRLPPGAISVSLVSLPGPGPAPGPPAGDGAPPVEKPAPAEAPKPAPPEKPAVSVAPPPPPPKPAEAPKPEVSLTPKVKEKKSLKEATRDSQKMIERAIERIEKKVNEPDPGSVASAIDRLKKKFADAEPRPGPPAAAAGQGGGGGLPGGAGGGGGGSGQIEPIDIYNATVASQVQRNWAFPQQLSGADKNLSVKIAFKVMPNGEITDIRYVERSSNAYLDDSAYKAIAKSSPLAPFPPSVKKPYIPYQITFTPEGMR